MPARASSLVDECAAPSIDEAGSGAHRSGGRATAFDGDALLEEALVQLEQLSSGMPARPEHDLAESVAQRHEIDRILAQVAERQRDTERRWSVIGA